MFATPCLSIISLSQPSDLMAYHLHQILFPIQMTPHYHYHSIDYHFLVYPKIDWLQMLYFQHKWVYHLYKVFSDPLRSPWTRYPNFRWMSLIAVFLETLVEVVRMSIIGLDTIFLCSLFKTFNFHTSTFSSMLLSHSRLWNFTQSLEDHLNISVRQIVTKKFLIQILTTQCCISTSQIF